MKKALFEELTASIHQAGSIRRGERAAARTFEVTPDDVRGIRERLDKSQSEFAQMIGVTRSTLQNWEQGRRTPQGPARALLVVASREPKLVAKALASAARRTTGSTKSRRAPATAAKTGRAAAPRRRKPVAK